MNESIKILVADDESIGRQLLEAILMPEGYEIVFGCDGQEALDVALQELPDIILLDVMMPKLDGFEVCQKIRENKSTASIPVFLITALDDRDSRIRGIDSGADDYISKPFDRVEILGKIKNRTNAIVNSKNQASAQESDLSEDKNGISISPLFNVLLQQLSKIDSLDENLSIVRSSKDALSQHAYFQLKLNGGTFSLYISNKLTNEEAAIANCIFAKIWNDILLDGDISPSQSLQNGVKLLNDLGTAKNIKQLSKAAFSIVLIYKHKDSEEVLISGLNHLVFIQQHDALLNSDQESSFQPFYLQGNQDLKFTLPTKAIILSPTISENTTQNELLSYINSNLREVPQQEFISKTLKRFNDINDFLIIQLTL